MSESAPDDFWEESDVFLAELMKAGAAGNSYRLADLAVRQLARGGSRQRCWRWSSMPKVSLRS